MFYNNNNDDDNNNNNNNNKLGGAVVTSINDEPIWCVGRWVGGVRDPLGMTCLGAVGFCCFFTSPQPSLLLALGTEGHVVPSSPSGRGMVTEGGQMPLIAGEHDVAVER